MNKLREYVIVLLLYALLTLFMTYPLVLNLTTHVPFSGGDGYQNLWNFWWVKTAVLSGQSPYYTDYIFHPTGTSLALHTLSLYNSLLSIPLQEVFGLVGSFNILYLLTFILSGLGMYLLTEYLTGDKRAAFIAGVMFAFCPYRFDHALDGHINLLSTQFIPPYILYLIKTKREDNWVNPLLASVFLFLTSLCCWHYMAHMFIFTGLFLAYSLWFGRRLDPVLIKKIMASFILFSFLIAPFIYPLLMNMGNGGESTPLEFAITFSADPVSFFTPSPNHPVFGRYTSGVYDRLSGTPSEKIQFLGYLVLFLSLYYIIKKDPISGFAKTKWDTARRLFKEPANLIKLMSIIGLVLLVFFFVFRSYYLMYILSAVFALSFVSLYYVLKERKIGFWLLGAAFFFTLSLGPLLHFNGNIYAFVLPYLPFHFIPGLSFLRDPVRFGLLGFFALTVLSAFSLADILKKVNRKNIVTLLILLLVLFEFSSVQPLDYVEKPSFYDEIASEKGDFAVMDVPVLFFSSGNPRYMFYQCLHEKKMVGGYLAIQEPSSEEFLENTPLIQALKDPVLLESTGSFMDVTLNGFYRPAPEYEDLIDDAFNESVKTQGVKNWIRYDASASAAWASLRDMNQDHAQGDIVTQDLSAMGAQVLSHYNVKYLIVHWEDLTEEEEIAVKSILKDFLEEPVRVYGDDKTDVYLVPEKENTTFAKLGSGWHLKEPLESEATRWMSDEAFIEFINTKEGKVNISFYVKSQGGPRELQVFLNGDFLGDFTIPENYTLIELDDIEFVEGENIIRAQADGCADQRDLFLGTLERKVRCVSLAFKDISYSSAQ